MRSNMRVDEIPLTYSKPSVIQETKAHFDSLLRKAADKGDNSNTTDHDKKNQSQVLSPVHSLSSGNQVQQSRMRKKKPYRNSKQKLIESDDDLSLTDEDIITSNDEIYAHDNISNDILVHCNPGFTSDSDSKESSNNQDNDNHKKITHTTHVNEKRIEPNATKYDLPSNNSSLSKKSALVISSLKSSDKELHGLRSSASSEEKSDNDHVSNVNEAYDHEGSMNKESPPVPPPRTKKMSGKTPLLQRLSKLSLNFSHSTLSSHRSSEDSIQTAVHLSPTENPIQDQDSPKDEESIAERTHKTQPKTLKENIELKPLTEMTPSYEEIDESQSPSRSAERTLRKTRKNRDKMPKKPTDYSIQSYDEIEEDSQNEVVPEVSASQDERKNLRSKQNRSSNESSAKLKRGRKRAERSRYDSEEDDEEQNANYNYDQVFGILIHHCDRLQVDSLIIHPVVRVHVIDIATGKYLKKSDKDRCYSYEEQSNIDFIQPISTQPCNFSSLRSLTPTWEEMLIINEDIEYITAQGMNVIILFEISDFVSFDMASLQYKKLGSEGGWHRIAWAFLKPVASNGSTNLNKRLRLQLFRPAPERRAKSSSEKCDVYQHWLKGSRTRYPSTLHVSVLGVNPTSDLPSPHSTFHQDLGSIDVLSPTLGLPADQDHDSATEVPDQKSSKDDIDKYVDSPEVVSWSRIPGQTCKIPNEKSLILPAGNLGCFCLRFSPCGKFLAADSANHNSHSLLIYGIPDGSLVKRFHGHQGLIYDLQWSKRSKFILSASADCTACVWDVETALVKMLPHPSFVYSASFFREDDQALHVVTGCCDQVLRVWMRSDKHSDFQLVNALRGHNGFITSICHDETGKFYSGDSEGKIRIWSCDGSDLSLIREVQIRELNGVTISRLVPHPGGQRLLIHTRDNTLRMINITTTSPIQWFSGALNHRLQTGATLSPCGRLVLSASEDGTFWVWNADTGKQLAVYSDSIQRAASQRSVLPLSGTVDYHPLEHMAAFSTYGKHAPIVVCVYTKNASGKSIGLQLMTANTKESSTLMSHDAICDWMKIGRKRPEAADCKDSLVTRVDQRINATKSPQSYAGSLASIIQQMDEVIALTRRSNHSSDGASKKPSLPRRTPVYHPNTPPPEHPQNTERQRNKAPPEGSTFPQLTQVSESRVSSGSSSSSTSIRRNRRDVLHEQHQIKRRHSGFGARRESADVHVEETLQTGRSSSVVFAQVSPLTTTTEKNAGRLGDLKSSENTPKKSKAFTHHVMSVSSINSDSDSHVIDLTEILS